MKRMTYFVMALALVLGLAQCKKEQPTPQNEGNVVMITLDVDGGASTGSATDGSKAEVDPPHVNFVDGDTILVASNGVYVGYLVKSTEGGVSKFRGSITDPTDGEPLYFYFLGNKQNSKTLTAGSTTTCTVSISDQTGYPTLPVISMGVSKQTYPAEGNSYTSRLYNKASLKKFNVTTDSNAAIFITGMNNTVTVDFSKVAETGTGLAGSDTDNGFSYSKDGAGIKIAGGSGSNVEKWAIVLPQEALAAGDGFSMFTEGFDYYGTRPAISAINGNSYLDGGVALTVNTPGNGVLPGVFTINGTQVRFSKGNLQAVFASAGTDCTWKFADHQYDCVGNATANTDVAEAGVSTAGTVDLFGWVGSSSIWTGVKKYGITNIDVPQSQDEGAVDGFGNSPTDALNDWGVLAISNGGNTENSGWRTMSADEWYDYLGNDSSYGAATVNGVFGNILLPDDFTDPKKNSSAYGINGAFLSFSDRQGTSSNVYTAADWAAMEAAGAVFLPLTGRRIGTTIEEYNQPIDYGGDIGLRYIYVGRYWTSTSVVVGEQTWCTRAYHIILSGSKPNGVRQNMMRSNGGPVRLVRNVE